jgi:non-heme chloroperoxidase
MERRDRENFLDRFTTNHFAVDGALAVSEDQRQQALALAAAAGDQALVASIGAFGCADFRGDLEKIPLPTLVIHGDSDAIVPFDVSGMRTPEMLDDAELVAVKAPPQGLNVSHSVEFNKHLLDILST